MVDRPTKWALADINTGEIIFEYDCKDTDFSDAPYDMKYDIHKEFDISDDYYDITFKIFDAIREEILKTGCVPYNLYKQYMERIIAVFPASYQRFYWDLSIKMDDDDMLNDNRLI